jgi:hypothetical protein
LGHHRHGHVDFDWFPSTLPDPGEVLVIGYAASGPRATLLATEWSYFNEGQVTSTGPVAQVNTCPLFGDGFETGDSSAWSRTVP